MRTLRRLGRQLNDVLFLAFCAAIVAGGLYLVYQAGYWFIHFTAAR